MTDRRALILERIDVAGQRGLELGPLQHPVVERAGAQVLYVDHADTATLRAKYEGHEVGDIVDVDVVWGDRRLRDALGSQGPVDYVVASHVIEHVPDLVGWLAEIAEVLEPGGVLSLAVPDKRFCFDRRRTESRLGDVVEAHLQQRTRPSPGQVFDFWANLREIDTGAAWAGAVDDVTPLGQDELALAKVREAAEAEGYVDVHCWVFTPASFLAVLRGLAGLGFLDAFTLAAFHPTLPGSLEFHVTLERLPDDLDTAARRSRFTADADEAAAGLSSSVDGHQLVLVSQRERALLTGKRRVAGAARRQVVRLRSVTRRSRPEGA